MMFEVWVSIALLGLWSCVGIIYKNSRKASRQLDDVVRLLGEIAAKKWCEIRRKRACSRLPRVNGASCVVAQLGSNDDSLLGQNDRRVSGRARS